MPLPSKTTTSGRRAAASARALETFETNDLAGEPAAGAPAADRRHAGDRGDLEVVGGGVPAGARERDEVGDRRAAARRAPARPARRGPSRRRPRRGRARAASRGAPRPRSSRRACRCRSRRSTARRSGSNTGGSKRKSAPTYGSPAASARDAQRNRSAGAEHRLVGEVDDDLGVAEARRRAARRSRLVAAQLLGAADEDRADPVVRQLERAPRGRPRGACSPSISATAFSAVRSSSGHASRPWAVTSRSIRAGVLLVLERRRGRTG